MTVVRTKAAIAVVGFSMAVPLTDAKGIPQGERLTRRAAQAAHELETDAPDVSVADAGSSGERPYILD